MKLYTCKECGFSYKDKKLAARCQEWYRKYKSCNTEIIKHAVNV